MDLFWSGKHNNHGGNIQVITAPAGWPLWTSDVRQRREHGTTALCEHTDLLPTLATWTAQQLRVLGYEPDEVDEEQEPPHTSSNSGSARLGQATRPPS